MAGGADFSSVLAPLDGASAITAVVAAAGVIAAVGFAKWGSRKVATFFDGDRDFGGYSHCDNCGNALHANDFVEEFDGSGGADHLCYECAHSEDDFYTPCESCGEEYFLSVLDENGVCANCHDYGGDVDPHGGQPCQCDSCGEYVMADDFDDSCGMCRFCFEDQ